MCAAACEGQRVEAEFARLVGSGFEGGFAREKVVEMSVDKCVGEQEILMCAQELGFDTPDGVAADGFARCVMRVAVQYAKRGEVLYAWKEVFARWGKFEHAAALRDDAASLKPSEQRLCVWRALQGVEGV